MATIINSPQGDPGHPADEGMGVGMIFGIIVTVLIILVIFFMYGWPAITGYYQQPAPQPAPTNINVTIPNPPPPPPYQPR